ncbi:hypothetical protein EST38_g5837 [Candolleomyces aberdarensis]|uniref:Helitron helicase-like domain-containing protein n=1 Tax=Candolleomyces aberdarensis TaxID=2316362 RepID=A0A4Q2DLE1_9AGAR|nr:hypothetical protein EST38_g5837 [Candolleomyces aberdarensis]
MSDQTPLAYRDMKLNAVQRCLAGKPFIRIQKGDGLIPDFNNPYLLSWVLPHLDPWGIGGFYHPKRKRYISMEEQLGHMLRVDDECFEQDGEFAFLFYNIIRKKNVNHGIRFSAPARKYRRVVSDLLAIDKIRLVTLAEKLRGNPLYRPTDESELRILEVLKSINLMARDIPGGAAQKLRMRNEIRGLMVSLGSPALFITLNPSDKDNPLVQIYAHSGATIEDIMRGVALSDWERRVLAAKNPAACARFFDSVIKAFIKYVLRFGETGVESMRITVKKTHPKMTYFTDLVTFLLKCNTDVKFIGAGSDANAFMYYVTDYITKAQMTLLVGVAALSYAIKRIESNSSKGIWSDTKRSPTNKL